MPQNNLFKKLSSKLSGSSSDLLDKLEKKTDDFMSKKTALDQYRRKDYVELVSDMNKKLNKDTDKSEKDIIRSLTKNLSNASPSLSRINRYNYSRNMRKMIPILDRAIRLLVENILSPDDITKKAMLIKVKHGTDEAKSDAESMYTEIVDEFKNYISYFELDEDSDAILEDTLHQGDMFIEISTIDDMFEMAAQATLNIKESDNESNQVINHLLLETETKMGNDDKIKKILTDGYIEFFETPIINNNIDRLNSNDFFNVAIREDNFNYNFFNEDDEEKISSDHSPIVNDTRFDSDVVKNKQLTIDKIRIIPRDPRNIIILRKGDFIIGYLYIDENKANWFDRTSINSYFTSSKGIANDEESLSNEFIEKMYSTIRLYLTRYKLSDVPDDLKDVVSNILNASNNNTLSVRFIPEQQIQHFKKYSSEYKPYGESYYNNMLFMMKLYVSRIIATTLYTLSRSGKHLAMYIDVTDSVDSAGRIEAVKRAIKQKIITADDLINSETIPSFVSSLEDFYLPSINGKRLVDIDSIDLGNYSDRKDDDTLLLKNIITGIEIPPSFLGIEEYNSGKATLTQESIVFARSIIRLQRQFSKNYTSLLHKIYCLLHSGQTDFDGNYKDVIVTFKTPAGITIETAKDHYSTLVDIKESMESLGLPESYFRDMYLSDVDWSSLAVKEIKKDVENSEISKEDLDFNFNDESLEQTESNI